MVTAPQAQAQVADFAAIDARGGASIEFVRTDGSELRVRSSPSPNAAITGYLPNGSRVSVLSRQGGWSRLTTGGWVSSQFLSTSGVGGGGGSSSGTLFPGDSGSAVIRLQEALAAEGYYFGAIDGVYGSGTTNAVYRFQLDNDLSADGVAGPATFAALDGTGGGGGGGDSSDILFPGDRGPGVTALQQALAAEGYYFGVIDGVYGSGTTSAVSRFQIDNGLSADGVAGPATLDALYGTGGGGGGGGSSDILFPGDRGPDVTALQQALAAEGYYFGVIDGVYGSGTTSAVSRFQINNGLSADGIAGPATLDALYGTGGGGGGGGSSDIYYPGDSGAGVVTLQQALASEGYYFGAIDGVYGSGTTNAVYRFQLAAGLAADGIAGPATLSELGI
jgi:peptidoglycan hydrolase-like protein with peptidoglycan-binding domain